MSVCVCVCVCVCACKAYHFFVCASFPFLQNATTLTEIGVDWNWIKTYKIQNFTGQLSNLIISNLEICYLIWKSHKFYSSFL